MVFVTVSQVCCLTIHTHLNGATWDHFFSNIIWGEHRMLLSRICRIDQAALMCWSVIFQTIIACTAAAATSTASVFIHFLFSFFGTLGRHSIEYTHNAQIAVVYGAHLSIYYCPLLFNILHFWKSIELFLSDGDGGGGDGINNLESIGIVSLVSQSVQSFFLSLLVVFGVRVFRLFFFFLSFSSFFCFVLVCLCGMHTIDLQQQQQQQTSDGSFHLNNASGCDDCI